MKISFSVRVSLSSLVLCPTNVDPLGFPGLQALTQVTAKIYLGSCARPRNFLQVVNWGIHMSPELTIFLSHLIAISVFIV